MQHTVRLFVRQRVQNLHPLPIPYAVCDWTGKGEGRRKESCCDRRFVEKICRWVLRYLQYVFVCCFPNSESMWLDKVDRPVMNSQLCLRYQATSCSTLYQKRFIPLLGLSPPPSISWLLTCIRCYPPFRKPLVNVNTFEGTHEPSFTRRHVCLVLVRIGLHILSVSWLSWMLLSSGPGCPFSKKTRAVPETEFGHPNPARGLKPGGVTQRDMFVCKESSEAEWWYSRAVNIFIDRAVKLSFFLTWRHGDGRSPMN